MISLIATVLNEGDNMRRLLESLLQQTLQPDEIVICDGGSRDQTVAILREYQSRLPLRVLVEPGCNISAGRNRAIAAARGSIIAVTDAGVELEPDWLEKLTAPLRAGGDFPYVSGFFVPDPHTPFEAALGATTLPLADEIDGRRFIPSSRSVAFPKAAWAAVGGYPEWLDYCEDVVFDLRLRLLQADAAYPFVPEARVYFRPRTSLRAYVRQYYLYARGDGKADLWRKRHAVRYGTYLLGVPLILVLTLALHPAFALLGAVGGLVYTRVPYRRLRANLRLLARHHGRITTGSALYAAALIPVLRAAGDIAKMIGYPVGLRWRWQQRPPNWRKL
jgi:glycosyltransferase involved in cell wall biosynthesis